MNATKQGRNARCKCGSGRKYKNCCLQNTKECPKGNTQTQEENILTKELIFRKYLEYRGSFFQFLQWYNDTNPRLSEDCLNAVKQLREKWNHTSLNSSGNDFFAMKEYHSVINGELSLEKGMWAEYIHKGMNFRLLLMRMAHETECMRTMYDSESENEEEVSKEPERQIQIPDDGIEKQNCDETTISDITVDSSETKDNISINTTPINDSVSEPIKDAINNYRERLCLLTIPDLRQMCKDNGVSGYAAKPKREIVELLISQFQKNCRALYNNRQMTVEALRHICRALNINFMSSNTNAKPRFLTKTQMREAIMAYNAKHMESAQPPPPLPSTPIEVNSLPQKDNCDQHQSMETCSNTNSIPAKKKVIPKHIRHLVWNHYIGPDIIKHRCLCCKKSLIEITNFHVGHVQSERNGGSCEISNLRPICAPCNLSMGCENMVDFVKKYGLFIG